MFKVSLVEPHARAPSRNSNLDAGHDLHASEEVIIPARTRRLVSTGLKVQIPSDCYARVAPRSGLAVKSVDVGAGVVDSSYRGIVKVLVINNKDEEFNVNIGDRIAQLILERIYNDDFSVVSETELSDTTRGDGGFGSTGI
jgi:dUTP pyrophosphatase